jgi:methylmalonyl-CoA/ethylmalonyl-CoA epimerase
MTFHHFGLLSSNPEESRQVLIDLGYEVSEAVDDPLQQVRLHWARHGSLPCVEIISPTDAPGAVSNLVKRFQQGIYHLCFEVADIQACLERFSVHSRVMLVSPPKPAVLFRNRQVSFHFVENFGLVELLEQNEID